MKHPTLNNIIIKPAILKLLEKLGWTWLYGEHWMRYPGCYFSNLNSRIIIRDLEIELKNIVRKKLNWPSLYLKFENETKSWYMGYSNNGFIKANSEVECWIKAVYSLNIIKDD